MTTFDCTRIRFVKAVTIPPTTDGHAPFEVNTEWWDRKGGTLEITLEDGYLRYTAGGRRQNVPLSNVISWEGEIAQPVVVAPDVRPEPPKVPVKRKRSRG